MPVMRAIKQLLWISGVLGIPVAMGIFAVNPSASLLWLLLPGLVVPALLIHGVQNALMDRRDKRAEREREKKEKAERLQAESMSALSDALKFFDSQARFYAGDLTAKVHRDALIRFLDEIVPQGVELPANDSSELAFFCRHLNDTLTRWSMAKTPPASELVAATIYDMVSDPRYGLAFKNSTHQTQE